MNERELAVDLAMATGDYTALRNLGIDTGYLEQQQAFDTYKQKKSTGNPDNSVGNGDVGDAPSESIQNIHDDRTGTIYVSGYGELTYEQLKAYVEKGSIVETQIPEEDADGNITKIKLYYVARR